MASATESPITRCCCGCGLVNGLLRLAGRLIAFGAQIVIDNCWHDHNRYNELVTPVACPGPLRQYELGGDGFELYGVLECATCGYFNIAGSVDDPRHRDTPLTEGLMS